MDEIIYNKGPDLIDQIGDDDKKKKNVWGKGKGGEKEGKEKGKPQQTPGSDPDYNGEGGELVRVVVVRQEWWGEGIPDPRGGTGS